MSSVEKASTVSIFDPRFKGTRNSDEYMFSLLYLDNLTKDRKKFCVDIEKLLNARYLLDAFAIALQRSPENPLSVIEKLEILEDCKEFWDARQQIKVWLRNSSPDTEILALRARILTCEKKAITFLVNDDDYEVRGQSFNPEYKLQFYLLQVNNAITKKCHVQHLKRFSLNEDITGYTEWWAEFCTPMSIGEAFNFFVAESNSIALLNSSLRSLFSQWVLKYFQEYTDDYLRERLLCALVNKLLQMTVSGIDFSTVQHYAEESIQCYRKWGVGINDIQIVNYTLGHCMEVAKNQ